MYLTHCFIDFSLTSNMKMVDGIFYCLNLNLSMHFRVGSRSLVTFKTELFITSVNCSFQSFPIFCHKQLHLRCCIELESNIVTWFSKNSKRYWGYTSLPHDWVQLGFLHSIRFLGFNMDQMEFISTHWHKFWLCYKFFCRGNTINMSSQNTQNFYLPPLLYALIQFW